MNYPKYQWSLFPNGKDGEQIVVRGDTFNEFILNIEEAKKAFVLNNKNKTAPIDKPEVDTAKICDNCGAEMNFREGTGKTTGKPYKGYFCSENCGAKPIFVH